jgi:hypothetical protein
MDVSVTDAVPILHDDDFPDLTVKLTPELRGFLREIADGRPGAKPNQFTVDELIPHLVAAKHLCLTKIGYVNDEILAAHAMLIQLCSAPLRILCLHGHAQSAATMHSKTGSVRSFCQKNGMSEWVYIDAPYEVPPCSHAMETGIEGPAFTWMPFELSAEGENWEWFARTERDVAKNCTKNATLELIVDVWNSQGPFDGIFGFSRGGALAAALAARACAAPAEPNHLPLHGLRFLMLCSAYMPLDNVSRGLLESGVCKKLPTVHMFGEADQIVTADRSNHLVRYFADVGSSPSTLWTHPGGHFVPSQCRKVLREFMATIAEEVAVGS